MQERERERRKSIIETLRSLYARNSRVIFPLSGKIRRERGARGGPVSTSPYVWVGAATVNFPRCCRQFQQQVIGVKSMLIVSPGLVHEDASRQEHHHHRWWWWWWWWVDRRREEVGGGHEREELMGTNRRSGYSLEPC